MRAGSCAAAATANSETTQNMENRNCSRELGIKQPAFTCQHSLTSLSVVLFIKVGEKWAERTQETRGKTSLMGYSVSQEGQQARGPQRLVF